MASQTVIIQKRCHFVKSDEEYEYLKQLEKQFDEHFKQLNKELDRLLRLKWYHKVYDWFRRKFK